MHRTLARPARLGSLPMALAIVGALAACGGSDDDTSSDSSPPVQMSLSATPVSPTAVDVRWSGLSAAPTRYELYINGAFYASAFPSSASSTSERVRVSSLTPSTNYCFFVYAVYAFGGAGSRSNESCVVTPAAGQ